MNFPTTTTAAAATCFKQSFDVCCKRKMSFCVLNFLEKQENKSWKNMKIVTQNFVTQFI